MQYLLGIAPIFVTLYGLMHGNADAMSSAILSKAGEAVQLALSLCGIMCLWCGLMKVAERSGLVKGLAALLSPLLSFLFRGLNKGGRAMQLISMNITANILGLGNATTPLGISAMRAIAEEEHNSGTASDNMIMLTVLNTASLQLIPTTAAALRSSYGAERPMEILPCVWIVSAYSLILTVSAAKLMAALSKRRKKHEPY